MFNLKNGLDKKYERKKSGVIDEMITSYKKEFWNKKLFEKAEFHQCIPNPEIPNELITV